MKNAGSQCCISFCFAEYLGKMLKGTTSATCNNGYWQLGCQQFCNVQRKPCLGSIMVHRSDQDLTCPCFHASLSPIQTFYFCFYSSPIEVNIPFPIRFFPCINSQYHALTSELL